MRQPLAVLKELDQVSTIQGLTDVFQSIASMRIAQIKDKVVSSKSFFAELWQIYTQLRTESGRAEEEEALIPKNGRTVFVAITSEGGLSGDIDQRIINQMTEKLDATTTDIIMIGAHGATLLAQKRVSMHSFFRLPDVFDRSIDVGPIVALINQYTNAVVYYETYISLANQQVRRMDLISAVQTMSQEQLEKAAAGEIISSVDYMFEPSLDEIISFMEAVMMEIALGQLILESKLAQFASRFNAMSAASEKSKEMASDLQRDYYRAKRGISDERLKEIINGMNNT